MYYDPQSYTNPNQTGAQVVPVYYPACCGQQIDIRDYGPAPMVINIDAAANQNNLFRTALWTGRHLQVTLMSIPAGGEIGLEVHYDLDQFVRIEEGQGMVRMGGNGGQPIYQMMVCKEYAILIPAGTVHNIINTGNGPLKLYSIYAPPAHPHGTVHRTREEAEHHE